MDPDHWLPVFDVRKIETLEHLTDEQASKIKSVHVYRLYRLSNNPSALYITSDDEVYLAGGDSLVGVIDMMLPGLKGSRLTPELSGKSIVKVVVGLQFGAALTASHELYLWGSDIGRIPDLQAGLSRLALEEHHDDVGPCPKCSRELVPRWQCNVSLSWCPKCKRSYNAVSSLPHPTTWVGRTQIVIGYKSCHARPNHAKSFCVRCDDQEKCGVLTVRDFKIVICGVCSHPINGNLPKIPPKANHPSRKVSYNTTPLHILDITAGWNFLLLRTSSELIIWGEFCDNKYNHALLNPDTVKFAKVACGYDHVAAITDKGEVYTCGDGKEGKLGYIWSVGWDGGWDGTRTLRKVELKEPALEVACGRNSTVCLLQYSTKVFGPYGIKVVNFGEVFLNTPNSLFCIPQFLPKKYLESITSAGEQLMKTRDDRSVLLTGDLTDHFILLGTKSENPPGAVGKPNLEPNNYLRSAQEIYGAGRSGIRITPTPRQMIVREMRDQYELAINYKEVRIGAESLYKLQKPHIPDNTLLLHDKAKDVEATKFL